VDFKVGVEVKVRSDAKGSSRYYRGMTGEIVEIIPAIRPSYFVHFKLERGAFYAEELELQTEQQ